ncbi:hypothetical protein CEQ90_03925 [Lewinellaceae bacterium SD302]|nr:hypothetical protein CEQ90_03925 [Lewinellaceae bacterium SD302]
MSVEKKAGSEKTDAWQETQTADADTGLENSRSEYHLDRSHEYLVPGFRDQTVGPSSGLLTTDTIPPDSLDEYLMRNDLPVYPINPTDTVPNPSDTSLINFGVTIEPDSLTPRFTGNTNDFRLSKDSLDAPVEYSARDSQHIDFINEEIHLFGDAKVTYQQVQLSADHIILNWGSNIVVAEPLRDSLGQRTGLPSFSDGGQEFTAKKLKYNFRTSKGIITDAVTSQDDIIIRGGTTKFLSGAIQVDDTTRADVIYTAGGIFTTCTDEHPHFGFRTTKAKIVPNQVAVIGPTNLEIMGVPTPLWLPFGFFPLKSGRSTGLIFPNDYEYSPVWGYGLRDFGWFFPLGEHVNLSVLGTYYLKGTWGVGATGSYRKRYGYSGNFTLRFDNQRAEANDGFVDFQNSMQIRWSHRQDPAAHPTANFGGSINFQTNQAQSRVYNSAAAVRQNTTNSNVNFTKSWDGQPFNLTASLSHSQSNRTREITVNFPQVRFQTQTIYPFRRKAENRVGKERWYEQVNFRYTNELKGTFVGSDTTFFTQETLDDARYGFRQNASTGLNFKVLKYFNLSPSVSYEETYYTRRSDFVFDGTTGVETDSTFDEFGNLMIDTTDFGTIRESLQTGLYGIREFSAGISLNTQFFGTIKFRKGKLRGLRHIVKPRITFGYQPDYLNNDRYNIILADTLLPELNRTYDRFDDGIFGGAPSGERQVGISYSIDNLFEAKIWNKRDSTTENVKLFQNIGISGSYNFQADSLKWSMIRISGGTKFFKDLTSVSLQAELDPYERIYDGSSVTGRRVDITTLSSSQTPFKLTQFNGTISTNITVAKIRQLFQGEEEEVITDVREERRRQREEENTLFEETDLLSLFENFSIRHNFNFRTRRLVDQSGTGARDTLRFETQAHSVELRGRIQMTENWRVDIGSIGYDFVAKDITYPYLSLARDLHCWEMRFSWAPTRGTYNFSIGVKPGTFDFLNVPYRRNRLDAEQLGGNMF